MVTSLRSTRRRKNAASSKTCCSQIIHFAVHLVAAACACGRLVHEFGVKAMLTPASASAAATVAPAPESAKPTKAAHDDDD